MARWWAPLVGGVGLGAVGAIAATLFSDASAAEVVGTAVASWVAGTGASMTANAYAERRSAARTRVEAAQRRDERAVVLPRGRTSTEHRPSWLLLPDNEVAPFRGRRSELDTLLAWADSGPDGQPVAVVKGAAGVGKTRLLIELAHRLDGEQVVVRARAGKEAGLVEALMALGDPAVVVVDLKQPRAGLAALLLDATRTDGRVKVAVECRGDGWLDGTRRDLRALDAADTEALNRALLLEVPTMGGVEDLQRWHREAVLDSARLLDIELHGEPSRTVLAGTSMLLVQAHAVVDVLQAARSQAVHPDEGQRPVLADVGLHLLGHERRSWPTSPGSAVDDTLQERAVCLLMLLGAQDEADAASVLARIPDLSDPGSEQQRRVLARWVRTVYPAPEKGRWVGRLEPGLLAHALCAQILSDPADLRSFVISGLSAGQLRRALATLMPALTTYPVLSSAVQALLAASPLNGLPQALATTLYLEQPRRADLLLADYLSDHPEQLDIGVLEQVLDRRLLHTRVVLLQRRCEQARSSGSTLKIADMLGDLALGLDQVRRYAEALDAAEEAVGLYRQLDRDDAAVHRPGLAAAVRTLAAALHEVERYPEALDAAEEAVRLYRQLDQDDAAAHRPGLAAVRLFAAELYGLGQPAKALDAAEEAERLFRELARDDPAAYRPGLAAAVRTLAAGLSGVGRYPEALDAAEEAVQLYRELHQDDPAAYRPVLAMAIRNLAAVLDQVGGRYAPALAADREAVRLYRQLDRDDPAVYRPDLALAVRHLATALERLERYPEALAVNKEAVQLYRQLGRDDLVPAGLAPAVGNLAVLLRRLGRYPEALTANKEAVRLYRQLDRDDPAVHRPDLALAVRNLAAGLEQLERYPEALRVFRQAAGLYRGLAQERPQLYSAWHAETEADIRQLEAGGWR